VLRERKVRLRRDPRSFLGSVLGRFLGRFLGSFLLAIPFLLFAYYVLPKKHMDFAYFYYSFQVVWKPLASQWLYDMSAQQAWFQQHHFHIYLFDQYVYPPQFAVLFSWLAAFTFPVAGYLWSGFAILSYLLGILMIRAVRHPQPHLFPRALFAIMAVLDFPFWWDLAVGNANWLIFFLISAGIYLRYVRNWPWLAGIPLGLATVFKVTPIVFLAYLLLRREWKVFAGGVMTLLVSTTITLLTVGFAPLAYYVYHLAAFTATSMKNGFAPYNSSLLGVLGLWRQRNSIDLSPATIHSLFVLYITLLALLIGLVLFRRRNSVQQDARPTLAVGILSMLIFSPLIEGTHLMIAWIAVWLLFGYWWDTHAKQQNTPLNRWKSVGVVLLFALQWTALSPVGWVLLTRMPSEYFYFLLILTAMSIVMFLSSGVTDRAGKPKKSLSING